MSTGSGALTAWRRAFELFERLLPLDPDSRARKLREIAVAEPQVHAQLVALLEADRGAESAGFLESDASAELDRLRDAAAASAPTLPDATFAAGQRFGAYTLVRPLGAGGMGEVWLARRDHGGYSQDVALKLLRAHVATPPVRARFVREGRFLAQLSHTNIAQLLDAGASADGQLWLAIEFVDGDRIDRWCEARGLDVRARLRLFLQVCRAVAHAHGRLVVHRDLKPGNVLVTHDGTVKLLDFGIGKLLDSEGQTAELTELTRIDARVMTPEYAAPEQVMGAPITTATDVHALGALLYTLLCGEPPFGRPGDAPLELARAVLEADPPPPSTRAAPAQRRELRGDLDDIVARALRKMPEQRYASAVALAEDVERFLRSEPVAARAGSRSYRAARFVRRHRTMIAAASLATLALVAGLVGALWQARVAREEARKATAIRDFLVGVFERNSVAHPDGARARRTTAEELLAQSAREIRTRLADAPEVRIELLGTMARLYATLDLQPQALALLEDKLAGERARFGESSLEVAKTLTSLAYSLTQAGRYPEAEASAQHALRIFRERGAEDAIEYAIALGHLGQVAMRSGRIQDGTMRRNFEASLRVVEAHHPHDPWRIEALMGLSRAATHDRDQRKSLDLARQALALIERGEVKVDAFTLGGVHQRIGSALHWMNRHAEAERHMRAAIAQYELGAGPDHPFAIDGRRELGVLLHWIGRRAEAKALLAAALASQERVKGVDDPELTTYARIDYANTLAMRGEFVAAEPHVERAVRVWRAAGAAPLPNALGSLGRLRTLQGRFGEADAVLADLEARTIAVFGQGSWAHATAINRVAALREAQGRSAEARAQYERIGREWPDEAKDLTANGAAAALGLVRLDLAAGDVARATARVTGLLPAIERSSGRADMPDEEAEAHLRLGIALLRGQRSADGAPDRGRAIAQLQQAVAMRERMDAPESPWLAEARLHLAMAHLGNGDRAEAARLVAQATRGLAAQAALEPRFRVLLEDARRAVEPGNSRRG